MILIEKKYTVKIQTHLFVFLFVLIIVICFEG